MKHLNVQQWDRTFNESLHVTRNTASKLMSLVSFKDFIVHPDRAEIEIFLNAILVKILHQLIDVTWRKLFNYDWWSLRMA